jgi:hypothetical protein
VKYPVPSEANGWDPVVSLDATCSKPESADSLYKIKETAETRRAKVTATQQEAQASIAEEAKRYLFQGLVKIDDPDLRVRGETFRPAGLEGWLEAP